MGRFVLAWMLCLSCLVGCRQVLGLKHATIEKEDGGKTSDAAATNMPAEQSLNGVPVLGAACETPVGSNCRECRNAQCDSSDLACLDDPKCRLRLDQYAICLGRACDKDSEACTTAVTKGTSLTVAGLKECLNACSQDCDRTPVVSPCELYCACMKGCPEEEQAFLGDCMTACQRWEVPLRICRRDHCERAQGQSGDGRTMHCQHANGRMDICTTTTGFKPQVCTDKNQSTLSCDHDSECCSGHCLGGGCQ